MPTLARWWIKSAMAYLVAALALGLARALGPWWDLPDLARAAGPVALHFFFVGWVTQMIFGVAYWMFPRATKERPRGNEALGWATFSALNVGLLGRAAAEPLGALGGAPWTAPVLVAAAALQWLAVVAFVGNTWRRVR
ncbi:MAG: hypothetical protein KC466_12500 [Myxococcales bacterium]|nr:hypothetical protein [Myxococcales bacterium]